MTSLAEAYDRAGRGDVRRLYLGTGLFVAGALLVVFGIASATTDLLAAAGLGVYAARELAGVAAGLGVPAVFVGVFTVLPASSRERAAAAIGASVAVFGVVLFWYAYPEQWYGAARNHLTLPVVIVYFLGTITTFWSLFTAVVNFKTRNDPGGTVTLRRTVGGETELVEVPVSELEGREVSDGSFGGVGILGDVDREPVTSPASDGGTRTETVGDPGTVGDAGDGGSSGGDRMSPGSNPDRYCGNCAFFDYARTGEGIRPYCGHHDRVMDDMEPCERWEPNAR